jgi:hypothetical protein
MSLAVKALAAFAADGSSPWYTVQGGEAQFGHNVVLGCLGSYGGGTMKVEIAFDQPSVQSPVLIATLLASIPTGIAQTGLVLPPGTRIRFTLTGSTAPTAVPYILE